MHTIRELVETLNRFIDFDYEFDATKPTGVRRRLLDISLAQERLGYQPATSLEEGLRLTWEWFTQHPQEYTHKQCYFENQESRGEIQDTRRVGPCPSKIEVKS